MIRFGYCAHGLTGLDLEASLTLSRHCGFTILDLGAQPGSKQISQADMARDPRGTGQHVRSLAEKQEIELHELFLVFVEVDGQGARPDVADATLRHQIVERFKPLAECAAEAGFASIMLAPGDNPDGLDPDAALENAADTLRGMYDVARSAGIAAHVEPSWNTIVNSKERVEALQKLVPELRLTLDYAHFIGAGVPVSTAYPFHSISGHIHLKPATSSSYKCPFAQNEVDFAGIVAELENSGWDGVVSAETIYPVGETDPDKNPITQGVLVLDAARKGLQ